MGMLHIYEFLTKWFNHGLNGITLKRKHVIFGKNLIINGKIAIYNSGNFYIGNNVKINSGKHYNQIGGDTRTILHALPGAEVHIGDGCRISNSTFYARKKISVGKNVYIGGNCKIYDSDYHSIYYEERISFPDPGIKDAPVDIQDGAFIGAHSIILKGVTIGKKSVIGAGSVVTKNIPSGEIWAGNPAKFIKNVN